MRFVLPAAVAALLSAAAPAAVATPDVPLSCTPVAGVRQRCSLAAVELAPKQDFHASLRLTYRFDCTGHDIGLVFSSEAASAPVRFGGSGPAPVSLEGYGPFRLEDADPEATFRATLAGECVVHVDRLDLTPSPEQLQLWRQQADDLARLLDAELADLRRAKTLAAVVAWDDDQLGATAARLDEQLRTALPPDLPYESLVYPADCDKPGRCGQLRDAADMPPGWAAAVLAAPNLPDLVALKAQVLSVEAGRPAWNAGDLARLRAQLATDVTAASALIANGDKWTQVIDDQLRALVARLKQLKDQAANV